MSLKVLDLFAGCGGLSLGMTQAGLEVVGACEIDAWAAETYRRNHSSTPVLQDDIKNVPDDYWKSHYSGVDLVAGGPPCQGFSVSGKRQFGVIPQSNSLVREFLRVVRLLNPRFVLMENVRGFATGKMPCQGSAMHFVRSSLEDLGYRVEAAIVQAAEFGVPSLRSRVFVFATRVALASDYLFPTRTHAEDSGSGFEAFITANQAISDLPPIKAREGSEAAQPYTTPAHTAFQRALRNGSRAVFNHVAMNHSARLVDRFGTIQPGGSSYKLSDDEWTETGDAIRYKSNNQRLHGDRPALCITANFQSTYIHPTLDRNLTAREAARLMTFPDAFIFCGKRTQMSSSLLRAEGREGENFLSQYNQIGNSVPPLLGQRFGEHISRLASRRKLARLPVGQLRLPMSLGV